MKKTDKLIKKLNSSSIGAFEQIMRGYSGYVSAVIRNHSRELLSREDMEEILSDTFVALWQNRAGIDPEKPLMPYLAVTARNKVMNCLRRTRLTVSIEDVELSDSSLEGQLENSAVVDDILNAAKTLSEKQHDVFIRFYLYGESLDTISKGMEISASDSRTSLFRAREAVKKYLSERGYFNE